MTVTESATIRPNPMRNATTVYGSMPPVSLLAGPETSSRATAAGLAGVVSHLGLAGLVEGRHPVRTSAADDRP